MSGYTPVRLELPGKVEVEILPRGLIIHRLIIHTTGSENDIVIGPEKPEDHLTQRYTNTIIGRYSNRIATGTHALERKGIKSVFQAIANENPKVSLHGGPIGFDAVEWTILPSDERPQLFSAAEVEKIHSLPETSYALFRLVSPDGDQGYPGELLNEVLFALVPSITGKLGNVVIVYRSRLSGREKTVTPVNLTQHWGFNLDASLVSTRPSEAVSVKEHLLTLGADRIAELDGFALPTSNYPLVSTVPAFDFRQPKSIGKDFPASGYDNYFRFADSLVHPLPRRTALSDIQSINILDEVLSQNPLSGPSSARLESMKAGIVLQFFSNQRGVMFYSNNANPKEGARKIIHGGSGVSGFGDSYGPGTAAFLEFHDPLSAFSAPENKDAEDTLLTSDELYNNFVRLEISLKNE